MKATTTKVTNVTKHAQDAQDVKEMPGVSTPAGATSPGLASHFSHTSLRQLQSCPLSWRLQRLDRVRPSHRGAGLVLGAVYHQALAWALTLLREGGVVAKEALAERFLALWQMELASGPPVRWTAKATEDSERALGVRLVEAWHDQGLPHFQEAEEIAAVELAFKVPLVNSAGEVLETPFEGIIDAITVGDTGRVVVIDHKTSAQAYGEAFVGLDLQATAYVHAARELGFGDATFQYHVMSKARRGPKLEIIEAPRSDDDVDRLWWIARQAERLVTAGVYLPVPPSWCCESCEYAEACRAAHRAKGAA